MTVVQGDITRQAVDAIVNAANTTLLGGGGVDGAIHRAAGPELLAECCTLGGCATGGAEMTKGYRLPARYVIHTPGPVWEGGHRGERALLTACYRNSLELALRNGCRRVAFPCISTGVYGYPKEAAARVAIETVRGFMERNPGMIDVCFCCFSPADAHMYEALLKEYEAEGGGQSREELADDGCPDRASK